MESKKLKRCAILLEDSLKKNAGESRDVDFLIEYKPLIAAIEDARACKVTEPRSLGGLDRWQLESGIQKFSDLSELLAKFSLLLNGWGLSAGRDGLD